MQFAWFEPKGDVFVTVKLKMADLPFLALPAGYRDVKNV